MTVHLKLLIAHYKNQGDRVDEVLYQEVMKTIEQVGYVTDLEEELEKERERVERLNDVNYHLQQKIFAHEEQVRKLEKLLEGNDGMSVKEIRSQFIDLHRHSLGVEKENERLREAITHSLEKHKWNNEESARILEQALGLLE